MIAMEFLWVHNGVERCFVMSTRKKEKLLLPEQEPDEGDRKAKKQNRRKEKEAAQEPETHPYPSTFLHPASWYCHFLALQSFLWQGMEFLVWRRENRPMLHVVCLFSLTATVVGFRRRWSLVQWGKLSALSKRKRPRLECLLSLAAMVRYLEKWHFNSV
jgi:hypothetical protein